jgi:hypothetical protein
MALILHFLFTIYFRWQWFFWVKYTGGKFRINMACVWAVLGTRPNAWSERSCFPQICDRGFIDDMENRCDLSEAVHIRSSVLCSGWKSFEARALVPTEKLLMVVVFVFNSYVVTGSYDEGMLGIIPMEYQDVA